MGCDMYCAMEALSKKTKTWECFGVSRPFRDYSLFSKIADVRNSEKEETYIEPIDEPRGWPGDTTGPSEAWLSYSGLYHSSTWLNRGELVTLDKWLKERGSKGLWEKLDFGKLTNLFNLEEGWAKAAFTRYCDIRVLFFFTD